MWELLIKVIYSRLNGKNMFDEKYEVFLNGFKNMNAEQRMDLLLDFHKFDEFKLSLKY